MGFFAPKDYIGLCLYRVMLKFLNLTCETSSVKKGTQQSAVLSSLLLYRGTGMSPQSKVIEEKVLLPVASYLHNNILSYPPLANIMCFREKIEVKVFQVSGKPQICGCITLKCQRSQTGLELPFS